MLGQNRKTWQDLYEKTPQPMRSRRQQISTYKSSSVLASLAAFVYRLSSNRTEVEPVRNGSDLDDRTVQNVAQKNAFGQRVLNFLLDDAFQRTRTISRVITLIGQPFACILFQLQHDLAIAEKHLETLQ